MAENKRDYYEVLGVSKDADEETTQSPNFARCIHNAKATLIKPPLRQVGDLPRKKAS